MLLEGRIADADRPCQIVRLRRVGLPYNCLFPSAMKDGLSAAKPIMGRAGRGLPGGPYWLGVIGFLVPIVGDSMGSRSGPTLAHGSETPRASGVRVRLEGEECHGGPRHLSFR